LLVGPGFANTESGGPNAKALAGAVILGSDPILSASPGQGINPENRRRRQGRVVGFGPWIVGLLWRTNNPGDILKLVS